MNCDQCGKLIGNTLYEVGEKKICPLCWLGEEGKEAKYQQFDSSWTEPILVASKNPPYGKLKGDATKEEIDAFRVEASKWIFKFKEAKWERKAA